MQTSEALQDEVGNILRARTGSRSMCCLEAKPAQPAWSAQAPRLRGLTPLGAPSVPKRGQLFIGLHNETLSVAAMRVGNEDRSPVALQR
jgi:hypothetical protein